MFLVWNWFHPIENMTGSAQYNWFPLRDEFTTPCLTHLKTCSSMLNRSLMTSTVNTNEQAMLVRSVHKMKAKAASCVAVGGGVFEGRKVWTAQGGRVIFWSIYHSVIYDPERSVDLRWLFDTVLHSTLDNLVIQSNRICARVKKIK